jgi:hypothetical protein
MSNSSKEASKEDEIRAKNLSKLNAKKKKDNEKLDILFLDEEEFQDEFEELYF